MISLFYFYILKCPKIELKINEWSWVVIEMFCLVKKKLFVAETDKYLCR